jgi:hypothetical protein
MILKTFNFWLQIGDDAKTKCGTMGSHNNRLTTSTAYSTATANTWGKSGTGDDINLVLSKSFMVRRMPLAVPWPCDLRLVQLSGRPILSRLVWTWVYMG